MKNKIIISIFIVLFSFFSSYSLATNNMMNSARNTVENAKNSITGAVTSTMNTMGNGIKNMDNTLTNAEGNMENNATNTMSGESMLSTTNGDYTATRTASNNNVLGMSSTTWAWLILGIVGLIIIGLVWYYGAQYEHKNYNND